MSLSVGLPTTSKPSCARPIGGITRSHRVSESASKLDCQANWVSLLFQPFFQSRCYSWLGAFACALWCEKRHPNSTRVVSYQWPFTTSSSSLASSTCRCKLTFLSSCLHFFCWFRVLFFAFVGLVTLDWTMEIHKHCFHYFRAGSQWWKASPAIAMPSATTQQKFKLSPPAAKKLSIRRGELSEICWREQLCHQQRRQNSAHVTENGKHE